MYQSALIVLLQDENEDLKREVNLLRMTVANLREEIKKLKEEIDGMSPTGR